MRCRAVSGSWEKIRRTVIPVQTGIQIRYLMAKTALDAGSHPTRLVRNDDELIALTIIKQPPRWGGADSVTPALSRDALWIVYTP
jgi:hypothetical protein